MPITADAFWRRLVALALLAAAPLALAQRQAPEAELKAAIVANMLLFVDWPVPSAQASDRLTLCFLAAGPVSTALRHLDSKPLRGKPLRVMRVDSAHVGACHALYLGPFDGASLPALAAGPRDAGVLLIGDSPGYLQRGAMVNLEIAEGRVVFDVDLRAVRLAGLGLSSKALHLARQVLE